MYSVLIVQYQDFSHIVQSLCTLSLHWKDISPSFLTIVSSFLLLFCEFLVVSWTELQCAYSSLPGFFCALYQTLSIFISHIEKIFPCVSYFVQCPAACLWIPSRFQDASVLNDQYQHFPLILQFLYSFLTVRRHFQYIGSVCLLVYIPIFFPPHCTNSLCTLFLLWEDNSLCFITILSNTFLPFSEFLVISKTVV